MPIAEIDASITSGTAGINSATSPLTGATNNSTVKLATLTPMSTIPAGGFSNGFSNGFFI